MGKKWLLIFRVFFFFFSSMLATQFLRIWLCLFLTTIFIQWVVGKCAHTHAHVNLCFVHKEGLKTLLVCLLLITSYIVSRFIFRVKTKHYSSSWSVTNYLVLQYVEVPLPTPKKDEVLIKVEAASLSPIDWKIQQGVLKPMFPRELPQIPGKYFLFYLGDVFSLFITSFTSIG